MYNSPCIKLEHPFKEQTNHAYVLTNMSFNASIPHSFKGKQMNDR